MSRIGGQVWNPLIRGTIEAKWPFKPMQFAQLSDYRPGCVHVALDHMTAAVESGELDTETWPEQLFATAADLREFIEELSGFDVCFRITDRWWHALADIVDTGDEEGFISTQDIADRLLETYDELLQRRRAQAAPSKAKKRAKATA